MLGEGAVFEGHVHVAVGQHKAVDAHLIGAAWSCSSLAVVEE